MESTIPSPEPKAEPSSPNALTCTVCGGSPGVCSPICSKAVAAIILANTLVGHEDKGKRAERVQRLHGLIKGMAESVRVPEDKQAEKWDALADALTAARDQAKWGA